MNKAYEVVQVTNGYVLRVSCQGDVAELKRLYDDPVYVFGSLKELIAYLSQELSEAEET